MKTSKTGYKDTSPDRGEKALMIPSNIISMKGVSQAITAIPIYNGKPDFSKKQILQPGQEDVTFEGAEGVMEIPMAQVGLNGSYTNANTYGFPNTVAPQSWQDFQNRYAPNGQGIQPNLNPNNIPQDFNFNNLSSYNNQNYNIPVTQPNPFVNNTSQPVESLNMQPVGIQSPSLTPSDVDFNTMRTETDRLGITQPNTRENPNGIQELSNLLNNFQGADLNSSLARAGFGFGFNASDYSWANPQAQNMASTGNTIATIGAVGNSVLKGAKDFMSGMASANRQAQAYQNYNEDMDRVLRNQNVSFYKEGGKIPQQKMDEMIVTGGYTTGLPENAPIVPNAEVEAKEFIQNPDGSVQKVLGEKHSQGGELMNLEDGTRVISDYLKIGGKLAKELSKEYDLKLQASNSFATVIDKYKKKIGLNELLEEQTSVAGKIKDQEEVDNDNVKEINLSYLSQRFNDIEAEKQPLDKQLSLFTNEIYNKQEESKVKDKPKKKYQEGGQVESDQILQAYSQFAGIPLEQLLQEFNTLSPEEQQQALGEMVQEMQGGQQQPDPQQIITAYAQATQSDPNTIAQQLQQLPPEQQQQALAQMMQQLQQTPQMQLGGILADAGTLVYKADNYLDNVFTKPQATITKLLTGEFQMPSDAIGVKEPGVKKATIDMLLDPFIGVPGYLQNKILHDLENRLEILPKVYNYLNDEADRQGYNGSETRFRDGGVKKYQQAGMVIADDTFNYNTPNRTNNFLLDLNNLPTFALPNPQAVVDWQLQHQNPNNPLIFDNFNANQRLGWYNKNIPYLADKYFETTTEGNIVPKSGDETVLNFQKDYNNYLRDTGNLMKERGFTPEEVENYVDQMKFLEEQTDGNTARGFDNKLGQFTSTRGTFKIPVVTPEQLKKLNDQGLFTARQVLNNTDKAKQILGDKYSEVVKGLDKHENADYTIGVVETQTPTSPPTETPITETVTNDPINVEQSQRSPQFPWMNMNQRVPMPMGLDFGRMQSINPININPINISPQEQLNTINSQTQTALDAINFTPGATRAAQIANIFNLGTQASNQAYAQTQAQNAQLNRQAEIFNETNVGQADRMNTELAENYQNRYLQALAALEGQQLGWYQYNNQVDALNMRNQFNSNIASTLFPNYQVDSSGNLTYTGGNQNYAPLRQTPPISKEGGEVKDFIRTMLNKKKK